MPSNTLDFNMTTEPEWFVSWFNHPAYLKLYQHRSQSEADMTIDLILGATGLNPKVATNVQSLKALDIACGSGRHAIALAERGFYVTANDISTLLLNEAKRAAKERKLGMRFMQNDMRDVRFEKEFDLIVQLFTSFGFFENRADDEQVIANNYRSLKVGGWYALDFFNAEFVIKTLEPHTTKQIEDMTITEDRKIIGDRVVKDISLSGKSSSTNGNQLKFKESVKLYSYGELESFLIESGFYIRNVFGNYDGSEFNPLVSPRVILLAQKISG
jgi:SAM-dependent methyltransferase